MTRFGMPGAAKLALTGAAVFALGCVAVATAQVGCSQTPTNVAVRTFERAQKVDVVCMQVLVPDPTTPGAEVPIPPVPQRQEECAPVPPNTDGTQLPFHLYALVTQTTRGEVAVVDLTAGLVIDEDRSAPGINFIPVGALPTDITVAPDGLMTFVSAAEVDKPAIYGIPNNRILGDSQGLRPDQDPPRPTLPSLPVCALPQSPGSIFVVPSSLVGVADGGAPDSGSDAGATDGATTDAGIVDAAAGEAGATDAGAESGAPANAVGYALAVVLSGDSRSPARVVIVDPAPLLRGGGLDAGDGPVIAPGSLAPCPILGELDLSSAVQTAVAPQGPAWDDGVKYVDGGVNPADAEPAPAASCVGGALDGGDASLVDAASLDTGAAPSNGPPDRAQASAAVVDGQTLYVADAVLPIIHVIDLSTPGAPRELTPLLATSVNDPARRVTVGGIAVSPSTRDFKRFLYAIDKKDSPASLMVFDVTDPVASPRVPLTRPHPEINPFQPPDRIVFPAAPVAAIAFVRHDFPLVRDANGVPVTGAAKTGLLCNPNPNVDGPTPGFYTDPGGNYRANSPTTQDFPLAPGRLRGIFAFATLSNGLVVPIDVDDWDAPCRRPDSMVGPTSDVAPAEPDGGTSDTDPYHAPTVNEINGSAVSIEAFFPVSAPHRPRSLNFLRNDLQTGNHTPSLSSFPQLQNGSAAVPVTGPGAAQNPIMLPTSTSLPDPSTIGIDAKIFAQSPGVRFAWEDPQVHFNQNWTVTYEGTLPTFEGVATTVETTDYQTLTLSQPNGLFCRGGVEDFQLGTERAHAVNAAVDATPPLPRPGRLDHWVGDYVQVADDILDVNDPYWTLDSTGLDDCWAGVPKEQRHDACQATYGNAGDQSVQRDFPILQAFDDHLVISRFNYPNGETPTTSNREVTPLDASNVPFMQSMRCCFHHQVHFHVRAGGQWLTLGSVVGLLHHVTTDPLAGGACVQSCDPREVLLNARSVGLIPPDPDKDGSRTFSGAPIDRNSALAMRNPMFAFLMWNGRTPTAANATTFIDVRAPRDSQWTFQVRGEFTPQTINLSPSSTQVSPQSMLFIDSLGQLAIVDGASQGLVLIDLNSVAIAHTPYF